jgi:hypothetical protein
MDKPRAELIRDLLADQQPILEMLAVTIEQAKAGRKEQALRGMHKITGEALKQVGDFLSPPKGRKRK